MESVTELFPKITVGLDLGDRLSSVCEVDVGGTVVSRTSVSTTPEGMARHFEGRERCRVVLEVGTHSPWVSRHLEALGHEVIVANPALMYGRGHRRKRNDRMDGEFLARQGRADPMLLHPLKHRGERAQEHLAILRARDQLVGVRRKLINHVRGAVKAVGARIGRCDADAFARRARADVPEPLKLALDALIETIARVTQQIRDYDRTLEGLVEERYPEARHLQQIPGVGVLTSLGFVLLVEDAGRFRRSRDVGAFFGLVPRLDDSSDARPQLRITKAGDELGRRLLVNAAHYILGPFGPDCDLRRHGEAIARRGGKNAKKRAAVAVARKLAVLLHRLWVTQAIYDPEYTQRQQAA